MMYQRQKDEGGRMKKMHAHALPSSHCASSFILHPSSLRPRPAFSFAEVLFAVIVLGIGFIMIAAVFPVAITQSKATKEETTAAAVVQQGVQLLQQAGQWDAATWTWEVPLGSGNIQDQPFQPANTRPWPDQALPHSARFFAGNTPVYPPLPTYVAAGPETPGLLVRGQMKPISQRDFDPYVRRVAEMLRSSRPSLSDPRFAWVAFYRRDVTLYKSFANQNNQAAWREVPSNFAQIVVMGVVSQGEGHPTFNANSYVTANNLPDPQSDVYQGINNNTWDFTNLDPRPVRAVLRRNNVNDPVAHVLISPLASGDPFYDSTRAAEYATFPQAVAMGSYLVIGDDQILGTHSAGYLNGRIYRVGAYIGKNGTADEYELLPDGDLEARDLGVDGVAGPNSQNANFNDDIYAIGEDDSRSGITFRGPAIAFVMGKPMQVRSDVTQGFSGGLMDISVYSTFIQAK